MAVHYSEGLRYTYSRHRLVRALLRLLVVVSIAALLFSSTAADAKLECPEIYELYNITRILTTPPRPIDCYVEGEMPGDNPEHCTAFRYSVDGRDLNPSVPCCWPGRKGSKIPDHLKGIVKINEDGKIYVDHYKAREQNVLIPLIGPYPDRIDFAVTAFNARDCLTDCANDFNRCKSKCYRERGHAHWLQFMAETTVTFAYSRTPGFDPVLKPDYPVWANDLFGRQCPLCRNSVPILPTSFVDPDYAEPRDAIKFSVIPSTNTLNRYFWPADDHSPYFSLGQMRLELPGGACSNEGGFRPWILDNGTTLGYYIPFRLLRPERVSGYNPNGKDETGLPFYSTEGHYELTGDIGKCEIELFFGPQYKLLVESGDLLPPPKPPKWLPWTP